MNTIIKYMSLINFIGLSIISMTLSSCVSENSNLEKTKIIKVDSVSNDTISVNDSLQETTEDFDFEKEENLIFSLADTLKKSAFYFFSNNQTKDLFLLTIEPGMIKNSNSKLQIITSDNKVIYTQDFQTRYFIKWIYEPNTAPTSGGQEVYEKYMQNYYKSITPLKYEKYFKNSVKDFFEAIYPITNNTEELKKWEEDEMEDKDFYAEVLADSTIQLIDIMCFDCYEGGTIIGYSKKQNNVISLLGHD